jgi:D-glycero-alpha-D-manno-heptose-7-phosphate kinase
MIICKTPFRISFFGGGTDWPEYFVENGGAVLGSAIDCSIYHSLTYFHSRLFDYCIRLAYRKVECVGGIDEIEHRPFREVLRLFEVTKDIEISLAANLPTFSGLGSSSSFVVGLVNALTAYRGRFIRKEDLAYKAIRIERDLLKDQVGCQDQVFAAFGGLNVVEFIRPDHIVVNRVVIDSDRLDEFNRSLLLYHTGITRKANEIEKEKIGQIAQKKDILFNMRKLVDDGHALLTSKKPLTKFGELLDRAWQEKRQLSANVSNATIDRLYARAREAGCLGGKLLGAGGGGFLLLFVPPERHERVRAALSDHYEVFFKLNAPGSYIVHS